MANTAVNQRFSALNDKEIFQHFIESDAILKGHFILSSGLHSDTYIQCAKLLMNPFLAEKLCAELATRLRSKLGENFADIVVSPAMGGVVVGYEMARQLGLKSIFCERVNGVFELRRGFELKKTDRVLVVEDVITTGKSSLETFECIRKYGAEIVAESSLIDRSNESELSEKIGVPVVSLLKLQVQTFAADNIPGGLQNIPAVKPGSRFIK